MPISLTILTCRSMTASTMSHAERRSHFAASFGVALSFVTWQDELCHLNFLRRSKYEQQCSRMRQYFIYLLLITLADRYTIYHFKTQYETTNAMSEHDQQLRTTHRDCSIPSSAPSEEAAWAASELSEAPVASRLRYHQNKQQTTKSELLSNDPALPPTPRGFGSRPRPRNPAISSESDRILEQDPTQNEQDGSIDLPQNSPSRPPFEYSDETSLADGPAALVLTSTDSSNGPPSMPAQSPQTPVATASPGMKALIAQVPSPRLDLNRCKNRCGGIVFDVLAQDVLPAQTNEHRESLIKTITELVNAIAANLGISLDNPDAKLRILEFAQALYFRARDRIRRAAKIQSAFRPVEESGSLAQDQLYCLMMALRVVDRRMREVDEADLDAFEACCWVAAMKWQIDIHKNWITDLTVERKRKGRDGDEATASSCKHRRTVSNESEDSSNTALKRRPGRPAGVKNKKTVAAERREATIAATRNQNTALPVTPTRAPRPPRTTYVRSASRAWLLHRYSTIHSFTGTTPI